MRNFTAIQLNTLKIEASRLSQLSVAFNTAVLSLNEPTAEQCQQIAVQLDAVIDQAMATAEVLGNFPQSEQQAFDNLEKALDEHGVALEVNKTFNVLLEAIQDYCISEKELKDTLAGLAYIQRIFNEHLDQTADQISEEIYKGGSND